jgi:GT2 family glycosyltransferase
MVVYDRPPEVEPRETGQPLLSTRQGGLVAVDEGLLELWRAAAGRSLEELTRTKPQYAALSGIVAEALACLAEAGLLSRTPAAPAPEPTSRPLSGDPTASAVIVVSVPGELVWLEACVRALMLQHQALEQILVVDNAVGVDLRRWLFERTLVATVHTLPKRTNFAAAVNAGAAAIARSEYLLFMNADVRPHAFCVRNLIARARETPRCAAVAPKLYFWRAPAFLNGLGNRVPGWGFGTDNGIGQLDLGQLDDWTEVPSGCLGCLLVAREALLDVGPFDARYVYYEDSDWSFRARLQGYRIAAAPDAHALHAFGGTWDEGTPASLSMPKLENALFGQLRFALTIPRRGRAALLALHGINDWGINIRGALRTRDAATLGVYARTAAKAAWSFSSALAARRRIQRRRVVADASLFAHADDLTPSMVWRNLPELTCASIRDYYAPLMRSGRTRRLPELGGGIARGCVGESEVS